MTTNAIKYITTIMQGPSSGGDFVDTLTNAERIQLREELAKTKHKDKLVRNLYYNYTTQEWID